MLAALRAHFSVARATFVRLDRSVTHDTAPLVRQARDALAELVGPAQPPYPPLRAA